jgi:hypothetical protein
MRTLKLLSTIGFASTIFLQVSGGLPAFAIETAPYTVLEKDGRFEIRQYQPQILAVTFVDDSLKAAGNVGFRRLFGYISGDNQTRASIPMTAPVGQKASSQKIDMTAPVSQTKTGNRWRVSFLMPASYSFETLPRPTDKQVELIQEPGRLMAAIRYSGSWSEEGYLKHKALLEDYISGRRLIKSGEAVWARYDSPFKPWFMRRNEILIPIEKFQPNMSDFSRRDVPRS